MGDHIDGQAALMGLPASHGDSIIEQDLVGDIGLGRDRKAQGQSTRMVIGAIPQVLEDVVGLREGRFADPIRPLATHGREACRVAIHPQRHIMAADASRSAGALGHAGRGVVRAARAEIRRADTDILGFEQTRLCLPEGGKPGRDIVVLVEFQHPLANRNGDVIGIKCPLDREQPGLALVPLANNTGLHTGAVELFLELHLDEGALLLHHDDGLEAFGEIQNFRGHHGPGASHLEDPNTEAIGHHFVDAQIIHGLAHIEIALADADDAQLGVLAARYHGAVELVGVDESHSRRPLVFMQAGFLRDEIQFAANVQAAFGHHEIIRDDDLHPVDGAIDRSRRFDVLLDAFHRGPGAGIARQRKAVEAIIQQFLHAGRIENGDHRIDEIELGLMRHGGGFRRVIIPHQGHDTAMLR